MSGRGRTSHSQGCSTCRKRKVRCDERQPTCLRCEKSQRECMGYRKPLIFIVSEDKTPVSKPSSPASSYAVERAGGLQIHSSDTFSPQPRTTGVVPLLCSPDISTGVSLSLNGFQDDIVISHLLAKLYRPPSETIAPPSGDAGSLDVLVRDYRRSSAYVAMLGVGQAFFGRVHGIRPLVDASRFRYVKALHQIQDELAASGRIVRGSMQWHTSLWCCSFLGMYEMICSSSSTAWIQHSRGLAALTEATGPEAFQSPATNMMLKINRSFIAVGSIAQRKRTFLERHDWQTVPWANSPVPKSTWIRLQDMMCRIPGLLEDADSLCIIQSAPSSTDSLQAKLLVLMHELDQLRASWERENAEARHCVSPREPDSPFTSVFYFSTYDSASECVHFDALTLLLYGVAERTGLVTDRSSPQHIRCRCFCSYQHVQEPELSSNETPDTGTMRHSAQSHALDILRSIEYMLASPDHGSLGAMVMIFPLRVAANYIDGCPAVLGWLDRQWRRLSRHEGFEISSRVMNIAKWDSNFTSANLRAINHASGL